MKMTALICLSAVTLTMTMNASADIIPARNSHAAKPSPAKTHAKATRPAPAFTGLTCRNTLNGGMVAFDSAVAISRSGARVISVTGGQTLYHLTTPDTLRKLTIVNPGCSPWELVGRDGIVREGVAEGAFVSFDAVTGRVVSIAVYQINRATEKEPQIVRVGDTVILRGRFLTVADAHQGRRIIQRGASEIRLNIRTGSVLATR